MTDPERINALESFASPDSVWVRNQFRDKTVISSVAVPLRPVPRAYAVKFSVPYWETLREAIDGYFEETGQPVK